MPSNPVRRRAARHQQVAGDADHAESADTAEAAPTASSAVPRTRTTRDRPITVDLVARTALEMVARDGYEALTMRRLATALDTGPASLYAHVVNKDDLDDLLLGLVCAQIRVPEPDPDRWQEQVADVCRQLRDQYLAHPGLSRAAMAAAPTNLEVLRVSEGMLTILVTGGVDPQDAAWGIDALTLYVNGYCLEMADYERRRRSSEDGWVVSREELLRRFAALPAGYPTTQRYAAELTSGQGHERFDFTLGLVLDGLAARTSPGPGASGS